MFPNPTENIIKPEVFLCLQGGIKREYWSNIFLFLAGKEMIKVREKHFRLAEAQPEPW